MRRTVQSFAGLTCRIVDAFPDDRRPSMLVVLCHGFGAPGNDLVSLAPALLGSSQRLALKCRFVFPEAPIDLGPMGMPGGRAWWPINMARLAAMNQTHDFDELTALRPDGMLAASEQLGAALTEIQKESGVDDASTMIGGFSQGAMVSTDLVLRHHRVPAAMLLFSGTLLDRDDWSRLAAEHPGCHVLQSHADDDPILPLSAAVSLHEMLQQNGFTGDLIEFSGGHTIPHPALQQLSLLLQQKLSEQHPNS